MKEDMLNIIVLDAHKEGKEKAEPPIPEPKKSTKNKLSLFDGKDSEKGSFFNFKWSTIEHLRINYGYLAAKKKRTDQFI